jgi:hypothetical protein
MRPALTQRNPGRRVVVIHEGFQGCQQRPGGRPGSALLDEAPGSVSGPQISDSGAPFVIVPGIQGHELVIPGGRVLWAIHAEPLRRSRRARAAHLNDGHPVTGPRAGSAGIPFLSLVDSPAHSSRRRSRIAISNSAPERLRIRTRRIGIPNPPRPRVGCRYTRSSGISYPPQRRVPARPRPTGTEPLGSCVASSEVAEGKPMSESGERTSGKGGKTPGQGRGC